MKSMTCKQLGGACEEIFQAETFDEMSELSKNHAMAMFAEGDEAHLEAAERMKTLMQDSSAMQQWFESRRREFDELPEE